MARRARRTSSRRSTRTTVSARSKVVWLALVGALTGLGGVLLAMDNGRAARSDLLAIPPLMAQTVSSGLEKIFQTRAPLDSKRWQYIVIHHSGQHFGNDASITEQHTKMGLKGNGHHFIIGNGAGMDDGQLNVAYRWNDQLPGAHAAGPKAAQFNNQAISICLVGNGDRSAPTKAQMAQLSALVSTLCRKFNIPRERVLLHSDIAPVSDPGRRFPEAQFRQALFDGN